MSPLQYNELMIIQTHKPMIMHTIELIEPIERSVNVCFCWAIKWHSENSPFKPRDWYVPTLGLDGVQ